MTRREFPKPVKRDAFLRANGHCEGRDCGLKLQPGRIHYDHVIPDALGGEPTLDNCAVLCTSCHANKTASKDVPTIAKSNRIRDKHRGITTAKRPMPGSRASGWKRRMDGTTVRRDP